MDQQGRCVFCEILAGRAEASFVYRDDVVAAFMDIRPAAPGHVLVVPNQHAASLEAVDPEICGHMLVVARRVASAIRRSGLRCEGVSFYLADGPAAGQTIFHSHLHVIPRYPGDGCGLRLHSQPPLVPGRAALEEQAGRIREELSEI